NERLPKYHGQKCLMAERYGRKKSRVERDPKGSRWAAIKCKAIPGRKVAGKFEKESVSICPEVRLTRIESSRKTQGERQGGDPQQLPADRRHLHRSGGFGRSGIVQIARSIPWDEPEAVGFLPSNTNRQT